MQDKETMARNQDPNVELEAWDDDASSEDAFGPDAPLTSSTAYQTTTTPKWFGGRGRTARTSLTLRRLRDRILRRRFFLVPWVAVLLVLFSSYALLCLLRGTPMFISPLPAYTGPYAVGTMDIEVPLDKPQHIRKGVVFRADAEPAFDLETVLFTLYYPISPGEHTSAPPHLWFPRPISVIAEGYAKLAHINFFFTRPLFTFVLWALAGSITIPGEVDAPLLDSDEHDGSWQRFPVMVFSHGMASRRNDYSNYLGEMASRGRVVAAIEHRDGSCPGTLIKINKQPDRKLLSFGEADVFSEPPLDKDQLQQAALAFRDAEIFQTIKVLKSINDGSGAAIYASNSRNEGSSLAGWADRLDFNHLVIGGHSFGATGALQALNGAPSKENPAIGGIILDPGKSSGPLNANVSVPVLVVHSNSWSKKHSLFYGRPHFDTVRDLVSDVMHRTGASWFVTSLGTSHPSVTDAPLLEPTLLSWTTGSSIDVKEGLKEYVRIAGDFFNHILKGNGTGVLAQGVTHPEYGQWVSEERKAEFPEDLAKYWEVHVSPVGA
ncbi:platelet-activating factor acetylhydrolase, isoform II-domain-containing protein [Stachybotrys elegans]|uniref:Putative phospholipase n=1 Tax=Stachybotrys elegans TaxID=80388 RepID=A0A8K0STQ6_9HYPO|nr:platelet-activating factor acetylhydrolase, isoform II-domain-containing protein [Stachybotrys elegans]